MEIVSFLDVGNVSSSPTQSTEKANDMYFFVYIKKYSVSTKGVSPQAAIITERFIAHQPSDLGQVTTQRYILCQLVSAT